MPGPLTNHASPTKVGTSLRRRPLCRGSSRPSPSHAPGTSTKLVHLLYKMVGGVVQLFGAGSFAALGAKMNKPSTKMNTRGGGGVFKKPRRPLGCPCEPLQANRQNRRTPILAEAHFLPFPLSRLPASSHTPKPAMRK